MIDSDGYRLNVGIILCNDQGKLFWARRAGMDSWQFPQGGIKSHETPEAAMFRELHEETGLKQQHVEVIGSTRRWLNYNLPRRYIRKDSHPLCIGQKQRWFLLRLTSTEKHVRFDCSERPEFDDWRWVHYWHPLKNVVYFKKAVYRKALNELGVMLTCDSNPVKADGFLSRSKYRTMRTSPAP